MNDLSLPNRVDIIALEREARRLRAEALRGAVIAAFRWLAGLLTPAGRPVAR